MGRISNELSGIVRNLPHETVKDGMMQELINLRLKNGALRPVGEKAETPAFPTELPIKHIHIISERVKLYIGITEDGFLKYWVYENGIISGVAVETTVYLPNLVSFASLSNVLMVTDQTNMNPHILIFSEDDMTYNVFSDIVYSGSMLFPDIPVSYAREYVEVFEHTNTFNTSVDGLPDALLGEYLKMQNDMADAGFLSGCVLIRCAWELMDGTIVKHTIPEKIWASEISTTYAFGGPIAEVLEKLVVTTEFSPYKIQYKLNCTTEWLNAVKAKYKNIIKNLIIYITPPRSPELNKQDDVVFGHRTYDVANLSEYIPKLEAATYFVLKEYNLESLTADTLVTIAPESVLDLETKARLPVDNFTHHVYCGKRLFTYNERIWLSDIKNYLYNGEPVISMLRTPDGGSIGTPYDIGIEYDIVVSQSKTVTVFSGWQSYNHYGPALVIEFWLKYQETTGGGRREQVRNDNSYWGYPDSRAKTARIYVRQGSIVKLAKTVNLISLQDQNFSYAPGVKVTADPEEGEEVNITYGQNFYFDHNRVQLTELNNPFAYPAINSYRIGMGEILGLSTNAIALSSGQFGQFPVFCFCSDGIWTMNIGAGETFINSITPLSEEVCNNPGSITPIHGGTAFTTNSGLYIISGAQVIEISEMAEGTHASALTLLPAYQSLVPSALKDHLCSASMLSYLSGATIGYDYEEKEIIVSNTSYKYSWVYSLKSKHWHKISSAWTGFVMNYPVTYGIKITGSEYLGRNETLFNWHAINDPRNIAPAGWHVPTVADFNTLIAYLGGRLVAGGRLKETGYVNWHEPNTGADNSSGFGARGAGRRNLAGTYSKLFEECAMWTADEVGDYEANSCHLWYNYTNASIYNSYDKRTGMSLRLIKDDSINPGNMIGNDEWIYRTVKIGNQVWMAENSHETQYRNGDLIPLYPDNSEWELLTDGGSCVWDFRSYISYHLQNLTQEIYNDPVTFFFETRPIKLSASDFKKIQRMLLHGYIPGAGSSLSISLFGSTDGYSWRLLNNGRALPGETTLLIGRSTHSCRRYKLVVSGQVSEAFHLTHIDSDFEDRYMNKLR